MTRRPSSIHHATGAQDDQLDLDSPDVVVQLARYTRLENLPSIVAYPNAEALDTATVAALLGCGTERLQAIQGALRKAVINAADELLKDIRFERAVRILPFRPGETVLAVGDSNTSDALSWAEILAEVLGRVRPQGLRFINAAVSADTSADLIARFHLIAAHHPNWLLVMIGTNDARRHGPNGLARMTSTGETRRNLHALAALAHKANARLVLITPPPIIDERVRAHRPWIQGSITWRAADVAAVAERIRRTGERVVDAHGALLEGATGSWVSDDGVHPTLAGQQRIVHALVTGLAGHA